MRFAAATIVLAKRMMIPPLRLAVTAKWAQQQGREAKVSKIIDRRFLSSSSSSATSAAASIRRTEGEQLPNEPSRTPSSSDPAANRPYISGDQTHFGYEQVPIKEKEEKVKQVFEGVADSYDVMNDFMSMGLHRLWKDTFVDKMALEQVERELGRSDDSDSDDGTSSFSILDVAGGTGDISFRMAKACPSAHITVCDINKEMLRVGKSRAAKLGHHLTFQQGNAQDLHDIPSNTYDIYTIAFGLRNVTDVDAALREANRVLKPGGRFLCLEFSPHLVSNSALLQQLYNIYSFEIIPQLGRYVANDEDSYKYLVESIRKFSTPTELQTRMEQAGMNCCTHEMLTQGVVAIHEGWKEVVL